VTRCLLRAARVSALLRYFQTRIPATAANTTAAIVEMIRQLRTRSPFSRPDARPVRCDLHSAARGAFLPEGAKCDRCGWCEQGFVTRKVCGLLRILTLRAISCEFCRSALILSGTNHIGNITALTEESRPKIRDSAREDALTRSGRPSASRLRAAPGRQAEGSDSSGGVTSAAVSASGATSSPDPVSPASAAEVSPASPSGVSGAASNSGPM